MKKLILLFALLCMGIQAGAQIAPVQYSHKGIRLTENNIKIPWAVQDSILARTGLEKDWRTGAHLRGWGMGTWITGSALAVSGSIMFLISSAGTLAGVIIAAPIAGQQGADNVVSSTTPYMTAGLAMSLSGILMVAAGIPLHCAGVKKLNNTVNRINRFSTAPEPVLELSFTPGGLGLSYKF